MNNRHIRTMSLAAAVLLGLAGLQPALARDTPQSLQEDAMLVETARAKITQAGLDGGGNSAVVVAANHGVISLSGWMHYASDPQRAAMLLRTLSGAKSVDTNVRTWSSKARP